jgi:hypothetical protein
METLSKGIKALPKEIFGKGRPQLTGRSAAFAGDD